MARARRKFFEGFSHSHEQDESKMKEIRKCDEIERYARDGGPGAWRRQQIVQRGDAPLFAKLSASVYGSFERMRCRNPKLNGRRVTSIATPKSSASTIEDGRLNMTAITASARSAIW